MTHGLLQWPDPMETAVLLGLPTAQQCYKRDFFKNVQLELTSKLDIYVFADRPPHFTIVPDAGDEIASAR